MSIETAIQNLADAINNLADVNRPMNVSIEIPEKKTDEPEKETSAPVSKKKVSKKKAAKKKPEPEAEVVEEVMPFDKVQAQLRGIAAKLTDTSLLFALIQKHGGTQLNDLDPSVFPQLIQEAEALLIDSDPLQ